MDDHAHLLGAEGEAMDAIPGGSFHKFCCCQSCGDFENDNVGLDGIYGGDPAQSCEHVSDLLGPAVVFVLNGRARTVVRRESFEDLVRCDVSS